MILGDRDFAFGQGGQSSGSIEPGRGDKPCDWKTGHILEEITPSLNSRLRLSVREAQELAFAGSHPPRAKAVEEAAVAGVIAMVETVEEDLEPSLGPSAQTACKR